MREVILNKPCVIAALKVILFPQANILIRLLVFTDSRTVFFVLSFDSLFIAPNNITSSLFLNLDCIEHHFRNDLSRMTFSKIVIIFLMFIPNYSPS